MFLNSELNKWVQEYYPYITFALLVILIIISIVIIIRVVSVNRKLGDQDFDILESIRKDDEGRLQFVITISNKAFSTNYLNMVGFQMRDINQILEESSIALAPRTKHAFTFEMEKIERLALRDINKFIKIILFAENELGLRQQYKGKLINKHLKRTFKENKKADKRAAKKERFETGNYRFYERFGLIIKLFFRPFYKLGQKMSRSTNSALKESELRRHYKLEHDRVNKKLSNVKSEIIEQKIKEESYKDNKTQETMLELLKQEKALELRRLKVEAYEKAFNEKKEEILSVDTEAEFNKYIEENPIIFENIEEEVLQQIFSEIRAELSVKDKDKPETKPETPEKEEVVKEEIVEEVAEETAKPETEEIAEVDLETLSTKQLKKLAKENNIEGFEKMNKTKLIEALKK